MKELEPYVIGRDPAQIEDIFQTLYRGGFYRGGPVLMSAISGIEISLWDIRGKLLGLPIYDLLGGSVREKIQVYCWIGGDRPADTAAAAVEKSKQGYKAVKMNGTAELDYIDNWSKVTAAVNRVRAAFDERLAPTANAFVR